MDEARATVDRPHHRFKRCMAGLIAVAGSSAPGPAVVLGSRSRYSGKSRWPMAAILCSRLYFSWYHIIITQPRPQCQEYRITTR